MSWSTMRTPPATITGNIIMKADVGIMAAADTAAGIIKEMNVERTMKKTVICFGDSNTFGYIPD